MPNHSIRFDFEENPDYGKKYETPWNLNETEGKKTIAK